MHFLQGQYVHAYSELLDVLALYRSVGYSKLHYTHHLLVVVNQHMGNYQEAIRHGLACVESARAARDTADMGLFYRRLGMLHQELNQWEEGLHFYRKALANYQQEKNVEIILRSSPLQMDE